jgi:hypothetical protein
MPNMVFCQRVALRPCGPWWHSIAARGHLLSCRRWRTAVLRISSTHVIVALNAIAVAATHGLNFAPSQRRHGIEPARRDQVLIHSKAFVLDPPQICYQMSGGIIRMGLTNVIQINSLEVVI